MGYLNRVWMAASVAVVHSHTDHGISSTHLRSLQRAGDRLASAAAAASVAVAAMGMGVGRGEERRKQQADDSLRKVMYLSCWGPS